MNGTKIFLDTNIVLYLLAGDQTLASFLDQKSWYISFITQLEILGYSKLTSEDKNRIADLFNHCVIIDINAEIKIKL